MGPQPYCRNHSGRLLLGDRLKRWRRVDQAVDPAVDLLPRHLVVEPNPDVDLAEAAEAVVPRLDQLRELQDIADSKRSVPVPVRVARSSFRCW